MRRFLGILVSLLALAVPAHAQTPNITSYTVGVFGPGVTPASGSPLSSTTYAVGAVTCNQAPIAPGATVTNPTKFEFDDAAHPGQACVGTLATTVLPALPNATGYVVYMQQTDNLGQTSPWSAASNPFGAQGAPAALANVRVIGS